MSSKPFQDHVSEHGEEEHMAGADSNDPLLQGVTLRLGKKRTRLWPWALHCVLLSISITFFLLGRRGRDRCTEAWSPITGEDASLRTVRFHGNLEHASPFKGPPSKEVDEAWDAILPLGVMSISEDVYRSLNASKHAAKAPPEVGGGYMAIYEGIHLIHCVRALWKTTYPSYYKEHHAMSVDKPSEWHEHLDHCADILRQKLMCDADNNLITYNWIKKHYTPHPNFNVQHQCRSYDHLLDLAAKQRIDGSRFKNGWILRPSDRPAVEFDKPPYDPDADE